MAQFNGYVVVPHNSYSQWRYYVLGNGFDVDRMYGNQCWDLVALLYWQYGLTLYTKPGGGVAADCWNISRQANSKSPFISLTGKENIKRGDILVWNKSSQSGTGHIAFADMDYADRRASDGRIRIMGQGQGSNVTNLTWSGFGNFLGIFRNTKWDSTPSPQPIPVEAPIKKKDFPWPVAWKHWRNFKH